jgi:hypothetical protein
VAIWTNASASDNPREKKETHQVDETALSGNETIQSGVGGVRWLDRLCSDVLQQGQAPYEDPILWRDGIRSICGGVCRGPQMRSTLGARGDGGVL